MAYHFLNPFLTVFETNKYPNARTLRTSLKVKLWDSFRTIAGNTLSLANLLDLLLLSLGLIKVPRFTNIYKIDESKPVHIGLFDYATLFIPLGGLFLLEKPAGISSKSQTIQIFSRLLFIGLILLQLPVIGIRYSVAALVTILASPIIAFTHLCSYLTAMNDRSEALSLKVIVPPKLFDSANYVAPKITLQDALDGHEMCLENIDITITDSDGNNLLYKSNNSLRSHENSDIDPSVAKSESKGQFRLNFFNGKRESYHKNGVFFAEINNNQKEKIAALCKLNIGGIVSNIEENEEENSHWFTRFGV